MRMQQNPVTHFLPLNETQLMMCAVITHTYVKHDNYLPNTTCEVNYITAYLGFFRKMCHQKMVDYLRRKRYCGMISRSTGAIPCIPKFGSVSSQYVLVLRTWKSKELCFFGSKICIKYSKHGSSSFSHTFNCMCFIAGHVVLFR